MFASFHNPDHFVIPTFYNQQSEAEDAVDIADANHYKIGANFVHRATYIQQLVTNAYHEHLDHLFEQSARKDPTILTDIFVGQHVLIEWPLAGPPTPQHASLRGPYFVQAKSANCLHLQHVSTPPPADQPSHILWSKHARVYSLDILEHGPIERHARDPAASQSAAGSPSLHIDCIIDDFVADGYDGDDRLHVKNRSYGARLWRPHGQALHPHVDRRYTYDEVKHTYAMDSYVACQPHLHGHVSILSMPAGWDPHAVSKQWRPAHHPALPNERHLPIFDPGLP